MLRGSVPSVQSGALHTFSRAPQAAIPRSKFNRSHGIKTTFDEGYLIPILVDEILPGDTMNLRLHAFARLATPIYPIMDNMYMETFFFAVPYRLVWDNWEKFNGFQVDPGDSTDFTIPTMTAPAMGGIAEGDLGDYFGLPTKINSIVFNSLHFRAYNLIWNEWFRDENMQDSVVVDHDNGPDTYTDYTVLRRGKRYDYFTSCLPFPQKGPDVELPLGSTAPVIGIGKANQVFNEANQNVWETGATATTLYANAATIAGGGADINKVFQIKGSAATGGTPEIYADLTDATAATINDLRLAFQTQKLYERDARGGTRYTEIIKSHFGRLIAELKSFLIDLELSLRQQGASVIAA